MKYFLSLLSGLIFTALTSVPAQAQFITKTLNVQGVLKTSGGTAIAGTYGMRFTFKRGGVAFTTPCQVTKNSVIVTAGVFNAGVDVSACNLQSEIPGATASPITVDIEVDLTSATYSTAAASFTGLPVTPVAMALVAEKAGNISLPGTSGQVLTHNGTNWAAGSVSGTSLTAASLNLGTSTALTGILPVASGGTGASSLAGVKTAIGAASSGANSDITSLTGLSTALSVAQGGTGSTTASGARSAISAAASGANSDITSLSGLLSAIAVSQGGTGAVTAVSARANLGAAAAGSNSDITALNALSTPISIAQGGTGGSTAPAARAAMGAASAGANTDITSLGGLSTALSIVQGGTGATSASGALTALGGAAAGTNTDITSITGTSASSNSDMAPTTGGTSSAYTLALSPYSRATGSTILFFANATNAASATLNVNSTGAATMFSSLTGAALAAGDLPTGKLLTAVYNGTNWIVTIPPILFTATSLSCSSPITSNTSVVCTAITATNTNVGDVVTCSPNGDPANTAGQVSWSALIATAGQISVRLGCNSTSNCALTARNWRCAVQK